MLHFILGGSGTGKSQKILELIEKYTKNGKDRISLIVPEQYSFTSEKKLLSYIGEYSANKVSVITFTSLAETILGKAGRQDKERLSAASSAVLMSMALNDVKDKLVVYAKHADRISSVKSFLSLESEFRQNAISPEMIDEKTAQMPDSLLKAKLCDISEIIKAFDSRVNDSFFNPEDALTELAGVAELDAYLSGRIVFIDSFRGFTAQEFMIINHILARSDEVYISLSCDNLVNCDSSAEIMTETFAKTKRTAGRIIAELKKANPEKDSKYDIIYPEKFERYKSPELKHLEKIISSDKDEIYEGECENITLFNAPDIYAECETAAAVIKKLIRENGFRCRDIAVIVRRAESYERPLKSALKKAGIPVYEDYRKSADVSPVINAVSAVLAAAADNFSTDSVMRYLKSGLSGISDEDVSALENYAFVWNISGRKWLDRWKSNPGGFGDTDETTEAILDYLNRVKDKSLKPVEEFRLKIRGGVKGAEALPALWDMLEKTELRKNTVSLAQSLADDGEEGAALELERMWDIMTDILSELCNIIESEKITAKKLSDYFEIMLSVQTVGTLPQGLDEIIIGSADRIRISSPRAVLILGANEGVFPPEPKTVSALNIKDREKMTEIGLELSDSPEWKLADEKLIVYSSLCCPSEKLYITCSRSDINGGEMNPSEFYIRIKKLFKNIGEHSYESLGGLFFIEGNQPAFEQYAKTADKTLENALETYFSEDEGSRNRLESLERAKHLRDFRLGSPEVIKRLFNDKLNLSASRIETFYQCGFRYFCKYTLGLNTLRQAQLDSIQIGNITHLILEILLKDPGVDALSEMSDGEIAVLISGISDKYIETFTAGSLDSERVKYQYSVLKKAAGEIIQRIITEFRHSKFRPKAFEYEIEGYVPEGSDGSVTVNGKIDRVDTAVSSETGKKYLRIIDYKTGNKEFRFDNVIKGFNLQMLIYLFALVKDREKRFGSFIPAGILYYIADSSIVNNDDNENDKKKSSRMDGVVAEDKEAITLMEDDASGRYIPASIDGKGVIKGNSLSREGFINLNKIIDSLITEMAAKLREGYIKALPRESASGSPCGYCDFRSVCGYEDGIETVEFKKDEPAAKKIILGKEEAK